MIALLLAILPAPHLPTDAVDVLERNSFYNEQGQLVFIQLVGWDYQTDGELHVRFWRMDKDTVLTPRYDHRLKLWSLTWTDVETQRRVLAGSYFESWLQYDPETADRTHLPVERRRPLKSR